MEEEEARTAVQMRGVNAADLETEQARLLQVNGRDGRMLDS